MFGSFGWMELLLILIIVLIIFGAGKIPQLGEGLGKAIKGFKRSVQEPEPTENGATPSSSEEPVADPSELENNHSESPSTQAPVHQPPPPPLEQETPHTIEKN